MILYCFPYAGGGSSIFFRWKSMLNSGIELRAIELAGRGNRIHEPFYKDIDEAINDVFSIISNNIINGENYAFFGHSMGAKIAYELTCKILEKGLKLPEYLFFSGRGAIYVRGKNDKEYYNLPDDQFLQEIVNLGGTPMEFFEYPELLKLFTPLLKNDFKLAAIDEKKNDLSLFPIDINIFIGKQEHFTPEQIDSWKNYTSKRCTIHYFNGGHFFINDQINEVVDTINNIIKLTS